MAAQLPRSLTLFDSVAIVLGTIIGSGIFIVPNLVARQLPSPSAILAVWLFSGLLSLAGALAYAELGAMMPASGGQYAYLREAFGRLPAFLCGWTYFLVIITAAIAWLANTFSIYLSHFLPLSDLARKTVAVGLIAALSAINYRGMRLGAFVQNLFAMIKVGGIILLVAAALLSPVNHWGEPSTGNFALPQFGLAMVACLLTYDGWVALSFVAGEVKNPQRNLPLGLILGIGAAIALFLTANYAYLKVLTVGETAASERVAARVAEVAMGRSWGAAVSFIILMSIVGAINGWILSAPRIYFAQARDGLLFERFAQIHPRYLTPGFSIVVQCLWACLLTITGTYETLGSFAMFASWLFYGATVLGLIVLRRKRPTMERPYRMWGYPVLPALFAAVAFGFVINTLLIDPKPALAGTAIILAGVPAYAVWSRQGSGT